MKLTGRPAQPAANPAPSGTADTAKADQGAEDEAPVFTRIGQPTVLASADAPATAKDAATPDAAPVDPAAKTQTASADAAQTVPSDPNVVHLKDAPDRDTQRNLMAQHKRWIVDETPGARQLFFRCGGVIVEVVHPTKAGVSDGPDSFGGFAWRTADAGAAHARLSAAGFSVSEPRPGRKPGTRVFTIKDRTFGAPTIVMDAEPAKV